MLHFPIMFSRKTEYKIAFHATHRITHSQNASYVQTRFTNQTVKRRNYKTLATFVQNTREHSRGIPANIHRTTLIQLCESLSNGRSKRMRTIFFFPSLFFFFHQRIQVSNLFSDFKRSERVAASVRKALYKTRGAQTRAERRNESGAGADRRSRDGARGGKG